MLFVLVKDPCLSIEQGSITLNSRDRGALVSMRTRDAFTRGVRVTFGSRKWLQAAPTTLLGHLPIPWCLFPPVSNYYELKSGLSSSSTSS